MLQCNTLLTTKRVVSESRILVGMRQKINANSKDDNTNRMLFFLLSKTAEKESLIFLCHIREKKVGTRQCVSIAFNRRYR